MRILVTGSSGQIGSLTVDEAASRDHQIVGLDRRASSWTSVQADIRDPPAYKAELASCDAVIHCAAQVSVERSVQDPVEDADTNIVGTIRLLEAAIEEGLERFVYVSSAAVYGDPVELPIGEQHPTRPQSPYGASKLAGERYARLFEQLHELDVVVVRPFNVYSERQDPSNPYSGVMSAFADRVQAGEPPVVHGDGSQTRDFIHARDVARWLVSAAGDRQMIPSGTVMNLGSGEETSILDLAETFIEASGRSLEPTFTKPREGDIQRSVADTSRATELGFEPQIPLEDGIEEMIEGQG